MIKSGLVLLGEEYSLAWLGAAPLVEHFNHTAHTAIGEDNGHAENGGSLVAGLLVDVGEKTRVRVWIPGVDHLSAGEHGTCDTIANGDANLAHVVQQSTQFVRVFVVQKQRDPIRIEQRLDHVGEHV